MRLVISNTLAEKKEIALPATTPAEAPSTRGSGRRDGKRQKEERVRVHTQRHGDLPIAFHPL